MPATERRVAVALVHYPVSNRKGEVIGSAVTNLDLHDIARACRTFGVARYYIVTPYAEQQEMVDKITGHWTHGHGAAVNPDRNQALSLIRVCASVAEAVKKVTAKWDEKPLVVATGAKARWKTMEYSRLREEIFQGRPVLVLFGTAWGLAHQELDGVDTALAPITGMDAYNHLSVRSAASIILDRLLTEEQCREDEIQNKKLLVTKH